MWSRLRAAPRSPCSAQPAGQSRSPRTSAHSSSAFAARELHEGRVLLTLDLPQQALALGDAVRQPLQQILLTLRGRRVGLRCEVHQASELAVDAGRIVDEVLARFRAVLDEPLLE